MGHLSNQVRTGGSTKGKNTTEMPTHEMEKNINAYLRTLNIDYDQSTVLMLD